MYEDDFRIDEMANLLEARLTVPEEAFVSGLTVKDVNREIDARIIGARGSPERKVRGVDLLYLSAVRNVRTRVDRSLRRDMRNAIAHAAGANATEARVHHFVFLLDEIRREILGPFEALERQHSEIEVRKGVLGGEPVIRGTRIAARLVADLIGRGATAAELRADLDLTQAQIDAALTFDRTTPKRGRPAARKSRTIYVSAA